MEVLFNTTNRNSFSYTEYRELIDQLLENNKTTGENHSAELINYTKMNVVRMKRWDKTAIINPELADEIKSAEPQKWIVLTEAWCGDAAQNLPWFNKMVELNPNFSLEILLRDENLDVMDLYLTNNTLSIPKLVVLNDKNEELFTWGPRPKLFQDTFSASKAAGIPGQELKESLHKQYAKDKGIELQNEVLAMLKSQNTLAAL